MRTATSATARPGGAGPEPHPTDEPRRSGPEGQPRSEPGWPRTGLWILRASALALVLGVAVFGSFVALRAPIYSPVDEGAHFEYVQYIADHGSVPVLGKQFATLQDLKVDPTFSTRRWGTNPRAMGFLGLAYEDFQPPLYYSVAVPAYELSANLHTKVVILRFFDLMLLGVSALLVARLARHLLKERWLVGFTAGMLALALPGVVVRAVTVSNTALAIVLTVACVTELWLARSSERGPRLVGAGVLVGLAMLTSLFAVVLVPVYALVAFGVVRRSRSRHDLMLAGAGAAAAIVLLAPWVAFNLVEYHALTATAVAKSEQLATVNPHHLVYGIGSVANGAGSWLVEPVMAQEWTVNNHPVLHWLVDLTGFVTVPLALVLGLSAGRRVLTAGYWLLALPWVLTVALCAGITWFGQWQTELSR